MTKETEIKAEPYQPMRKLLIEKINEPSYEAMKMGFRGKNFTTHLPPMKLNIREISFYEDRDMMCMDGYNPEKNTLTITIPVDEIEYVDEIRRQREPYDDVIVLLWKFLRQSIDTDKPVDKDDYEKALTLVHNYFDGDEDEQEITKIIRKMNAEEK